MGLNGAKDRGTLPQKEKLAPKGAKISKAAVSRLQRATCIADGFLVEQPTVHGCRLRCDTAPGNLLGCLLLPAGFGLAGRNKFAASSRDVPGIDEGCRSMLPADGDGGLQHANPLVERVAVLDTLDDSESSSGESGNCSAVGKETMPVVNRSP
jgi:hypothetical protein